MKSDDAIEARAERPAGGEAGDAAPALVASMLRQRLGGAHGPQLWRSLEELVRDPQAQAILRRELPHVLAELPELKDGPTRRGFLQLMGASLALAGLTSCTKQPLERLVPYVRQPEDLVPGKPLFFATATLLDGYATGVLVESHQGRPTKIEGNPEHAASLGAADAFAQASVLGLYDPDRSRTILHVDTIGTWSGFLDDLLGRLGELRGRGGAGLRVLSGAVTSPFLAAQMRELLAQYPRARWHQYEPAARHGAFQGAVQAFGAPVHSRYDFTLADVVVTLDADPFGSGSGALRYARQFSARRRAPETGAEMNRLYAVESTPTVSGTLADHRLPRRATEVGRFAVRLAAELGLVPMPAGGGDAESDRWAAVVGRDLAAHRGRSLVVPGDCAAPGVHVLAHALNAALGNVGSTVHYTDPVEAVPVDSMQSLSELVRDMRAGQVEVLIVLGTNPVYSAPGDVDFAGALQRVPMRVHLGRYRDETALRCHWHVPESHELEAWSDARAFDGTVSVVQPLIEPLYDTRTAHDLLRALLGHADESSYDALRRFWSGRLGGDFEAAWRRALHDGFVAGTALPARAVALQPGAAAAAAAQLAGAPPAGGDALELIVRPDPTVHDGRFANNAWLQELPKPWTKLTWDNAALVGPATAARLGVENESIVELRVGARSVRAPIWVTPGHPEEAVSVSLGYGREAGGQVAPGHGFDANRLRSSDSPWLGRVALRKLDGRWALAATQEHFGIEGRDLVRVQNWGQPHAEAHAQHGEVGTGRAPEPGSSMYPGFESSGYAWGMAIDLGACTGCNACVVACQAENNIPVVGKDQVQRGREMHWLRIDRYFEGPVDNPQVHHEPMLCQHCEQAPCEVVCPVGATAHSDEGLNEMTYNRCVGTRYCSNNCPYKVRRFNFYQYSERDVPVLKLLYNPDVTVRSRGVMEKCTFCVQRINQARIGAKREDRTIRDGEVVTACQQACPTEAIVFGDLHDETSRLAARRRDPRHFGLLTELNTRPRTTYLAKLRNPNPELETT